MAQSLLPLLLLITVGFLATVDASGCSQDLLKRLPKAAFGNLNLSNKRDASLIKKQLKWMGEGETDGVVINLGKVYEIQIINVLRGKVRRRPTFLILEYSMDGRNFLTKKLNGSQSSAFKKVNAMNPPIMASVIKVRASRQQMFKKRPVAFGINVFGCTPTIPTEAPTTPLPARTTPAEAPTTPLPARTTPEPTQAPTTLRAIKTTQGCSQDLLKGLPRAAFRNLDSRNKRAAMYIKMQFRWIGVGETDGVKINLGKVYEIQKINILRGKWLRRPKFLTLEYSMDGSNFLTKKLNGSWNPRQLKKVNIMNPPIMASVIKVRANRTEMSGKRSVAFGINVFGCNTIIPTEVPTTPLLARTTPAEAPTTPLPARTTPEPTQAPTTLRAIKTTQGCSRDLLKRLPKAAFRNYNLRNKRDASSIKRQLTWIGAGETDGVVIELGKVYEIQKINILRGMSFRRPYRLTLEYSMDGRNFLTKELSGSQSSKKFKTVNAMNPPIMASVIKVRANKQHMFRKSPISFGINVFGCTPTNSTEAPNTPLPARTTPAEAPNTPLPARTTPEPTQAPTTLRAIKTTQGRSRTTRSPRDNCGYVRNLKRPAGIVVAFDSSGSLASSLGQQANITEALYNLLTTKNVFCKRKMKMSFMTIGEGQNDTLQFQTKNFNNNRDFKRVANDKKDNFVQKQTGSSPSGLTDLGDAIKRATKATSFPQNAKKYLFLVSDFIITKNIDAFPDAVAEAKSLHWNIIPILMKSVGENKLGESNFNKAGGSENGINLQIDPISSQRIKQVLTSNGF